MLDSLKVTVLAEDTVPYESPLLGQHGVSFWLEAERKGHVRRILVDVGQNPDALLYNINQLQIPLRETDAIVLTHCHYDHTRGLAAVLKSIGKRDLPVIAHPSLFRLNFITDPFFRHVGVMQGDEADNLRKEGAELVPAADPLQLMPGLSTTGEVPRVTDFEEVGISLSTVTEDGRIEKDLMKDDIALTAGEGSWSGCGHRMQPCRHHHILRHCLKKDERLEGVIGGLHLVEASEDRIEKRSPPRGTFSLSRRRRSLHGFPGSVPVRGVQGAVRHHGIGNGVSLCAEKQEGEAKP